MLSYTHKTENITFSTWRSTTQLLRSVAGKAALMMLLGVTGSCCKPLSHASRIPIGRARRRLGLADLKTYSVKDKDHKAMKAGPIIDNGEGLFQTLFAKVKNNAAGSTFPYEAEITNCEERADKWNANKKTLTDKFNAKKKKLSTEEKKQLKTQIQQATFFVTRDNARTRRLKQKIQVVDQSTNNLMAEIKTLQNKHFLVAKVRTQLGFIGGMAGFLEQVLCLKTNRNETIKRAIYLLRSNQHRYLWASILLMSSLNGNYIVTQNLSTPSRYFQVIQKIFDVSKACGLFPGTRVNPYGIVLEEELVVAQEELNITCSKLKYIFENTKAAFGKAGRTLKDETLEKKELFESCVKCIRCPSTKLVLAQYSQRVEEKFGRDFTESNTTEAELKEIRSSIQSVMEMIKFRDQRSCDCRLCSEI